MSTSRNGMTVLLCAALIGNGALTAGPPAFYGKAEPTRITDVSLTDSGDWVGRYLDGDGRAIEGASVTVAQEGQLVARSTTDQEGNYRIPGVSAGVYQIAVGSESQVVRVWPKALAPPAAKPVLINVQNGQVVRGQFGGGGGMDLGLIFGVAGVTIGTIALIEARDAKDEASKLRRDMTTMTSGVVSP